jgi:hypothetical protein
MKETEENDFFAVSENKDIRSPKAVQFPNIKWDSFDNNDENKPEARIELSLAFPASPPRNVKFAVHTDSAHSPKRGKRIVSLDSASYLSYKETQKLRRIDRKSKRSNSTSAEDNLNVMRKLTAEDIDLSKTPLSSLRSCSEYHRSSIRPEVSRTIEPPKKKSMFSRMYNWMKGKKSDKNRAIIQNNNDEENEFLVEKFRFNQANLMEGEDYNYSNTTTPVKRDLRRSDASSSASLETKSVSFGGIIPRISFSPSFSDRQSPAMSSSYSRAPAALNNNSTNRSNSGMSGNAATQRPKKKSSTGGGGAAARALQESALVLDYLFGLSIGSSSNSKRLPMEIELRNLRDPEYISFKFSEIRPMDSEGRFIVNNREILGLPRTISFRSSSSLRSNSDANDPPEHLLVGSEYLPVEMIVFDAKDPTTWKPSLLQWHADVLTKLHHRNALHAAANECFYESIRMQPFASGAYMRAFMLAGFSSTCLLVSAMWLWPSHLSTTSPLLEMCIYSSTAIQLLINLAQLPHRLKIHYQCWECSRAVEVDVAIEVIRNLLHSDAWILNRTLTDIMDIAMVFSLCLCEVGFWSLSKSDPLFPLLVSIASTNILSVCCRVAVSMALAISNHNPQVLNDARQRGLSKWDLQTLPTFVFTHLDEVMNCECAICLNAFDKGEMLITLPCDNKHSFHASCIRQWLQRQNACPLCQKMV